MQLGAADATTASPPHKHAATQTVWEGYDVLYKATQFPDTEYASSILSQPLALSYSFGAWPHLGGWPMARRPAPVPIQQQIRDLAAATTIVTDAPTGDNKIVTDAEEDAENNEMDDDDAGPVTKTYADASTQTDMQCISMKDEAIQFPDPTQPQANKAADKKTQPCKPDMKGGAALYDGEDSSILKSMADDAAGGDSTVATIPVRVTRGASASPAP